MKAIVERGYAIPKEEIKRLVDEECRLRAAELAKASEKDRARIEKEIRLEVKRKILAGKGGDFRASLHRLLQRWKGSK